MKAKMKIVRFVHVAVRNSNVDNIPVFEDLDRIFDFNVWHSTKRNQHRMTCGSLGDALKRSLGMGYASWTKDYNASETFEDKQWEQPVIVRCNGKEFRAYHNSGYCQAGAMDRDNRGEEAFQRYRH